MIMIEQLCCIVYRVVPRLCNSHCDQWKAHNYMLTPEHHALCEPLDPIRQAAALHPEHSVLLSAAAPQLAHCSVNSTNST